MVGIGSRSLVAIYITASGMATTGTKAQLRECRKQLGECDMLLTAVAAGGNVNSQDKGTLAQVLDAIMTARSALAQLVKRKTSAAGGSAEGKGSGRANGKPGGQGKGRAGGQIKATKSKKRKGEQEVCFICSKVDPEFMSTDSNQEVAPSVPVCSLKCESEYLQSKGLWSVDERGKWQRTGSKKKPYKSTSHKRKRRQREELEDEEDEDSLDDSMEAEDEDGLTAPQLRQRRQRRQQKRWKQWQRILDKQKRLNTRRSRASAPAKAKAQKGTNAQQPEPKPGAERQLGVALLGALSREIRPGGGGGDGAQKLQGAGVLTRGEGLQATGALDL